MASSSLVDKVHNISVKLGLILATTPREDLLGNNPPQSFLFELRVLFELLDYLKNSKGWTVTPEHKPNGQYCFLRAPGLKKNATFFRVKKNAESYQVTHGSKIQDRYGEKRAPDISLQTGNAPLEPTHSDVLAIWDAKLRGSRGTLSDKRITDSEFGKFVYFMEVLNIKRPAQGLIPKDWPPALEVSALITNGEEPTEPRNAMLDRGFSVTSHYNGPKTQTEPSRRDHFRHRPAQRLMASSGPLT